jgi:hypothetical protein
MDLTLKLGKWVIEIAKIAIFAKIAGIVSWSGVGL